MKGGCSPAHKQLSKASEELTSRRVLPITRSSKRLNAFVRVHKFKLKSIYSAVASLHQEDFSFWASIDIRNVYLHFPICGGLSSLLDIGGS